MKVFGITGQPGSGRIELVARLVQAMAARGLRVSTIQHMPPAFDVDRPRRDSHRHRQAGASQVMLASRNRMALMSELRTAPQASLDDLLQRMRPCDLVIVCGDTEEDLPLIEVWRDDGGDIPMASEDAGILALVSDSVPDVVQPVFGTEDTTAITDFILREVGL
ncbi:molybdopterin-guanine dinucleotide biosynthesis protein B [Primorskyibacter aestuariivivens]|uniref:molybdopterin-guanine dinucleotide biosynthesis protein B n=1 Tax=Primorskyibacter aestuariivivens TaxID=1888912 RepID=UPI0023011545|nr:molybdopterin-guanine dinucleotide biosynthesis protein B [Primorskyibacter aestuariivivens]MDA7428255.1 molybdopterin-guanine dinucleotide biosynthesis protein B [Primorskyibacter aestuariivivens]